MKFLIQRVSEASCTADGTVTGRIGRGFLVLIGISDRDDEDVALRMVKKMIGLRIFEDENGKTNRSLRDANGGLLLISQFTLYADCKKGNRPSFTGAGKPDHAERLYERIIAACKQEVPCVERGIFGADMKIALLNDGPFTVLLDSDELFR